MFHDIRSEMARFNEYDDYAYSMKELNAELERLEIPYKTGGGTGNAYYDLTYKDRMNRKNQSAASIVESREAAEMLKIMKELM